MPVVLDLDGVTVLQLSQSLSILLLRLEQVLIPLLIEFLVLLDVRLLALLPLLSLVKDELLVSAVVVLLLKLSDPVLRHLSLNVLAFALTGVPVILEHLAVLEQKW